MISWLLAKLDKYGIKIIRGVDYDDNDTSWAKEFMN